MNRLLEISTTLATTMQAQTEFEIRLKNQKLDLEARQLALIPLNEKGQRGWPGANQEARETAEKLAYANDEICQRITAEILGYEEELARLENCVNALTNERRALEWTIRAKLVEALTGHVITVLESRQNVEDTAFDDFADEVADARLTEKFSHPSYEQANMRGSARAQENVDEPEFVSEPPAANGHTPETIFDYDIPW